MSDNTELIDALRRKADFFAPRFSFSGGKNETEALLKQAATALEASECEVEVVTVPTENERERLAAIAKHVIDAEVTYEESDWYLFADAVIAAGFRLSVPVEPEWEYRRRKPRGAQPPAIFEAMPVLDDGFWAQRRSVGDWEDVPPDEVTEGTQ